MSYTEMKQRCACCGNVVDIIKYYDSNGRPTNMDGKGSANPLSKTLRECPICHYVNTDLEKKLSNINIVETDVYKKLFQYTDEQKADKQFEFIQAVNRCQVYHDLIDVSDPERIHALLQICWLYEDIGNTKKAIEYRKQATNEYYKFFKKHNFRLSEVIICIDCLRQLGWFREAKHVIKVVNKDYFIKRRYLYSYGEEYILLLFEKQLIEAEDSDPHCETEINFLS